MSERGCLCERVCVWCVREDVWCVRGVGVCIYSSIESVTLMKSDLIDSDLL